MASEELAVFDAAADLDARAGQRLTPDPGLTWVLAPCGGVGRLIAALGEGLIPVRVVAFNKSVDHNWLVPWHQDRVITVAQRHDIPGFRNWSSKGGVWHCEPPVDVLAAMVFVRVHLDDAGPA